jgi:hypothetical protein
MKSPVFLDRETGVTWPDRMPEPGEARRETIPTPQATPHDRAVAFALTSQQSHANQSVQGRSVPTMALRAALSAVQRSCGNSAAAALTGTRLTPASYPPGAERDTGRDERDAEATGSRLGPALPALTDDEMQLARSPGLMLPDRIRHTAEQQLGTELPPVRLHAGPAAHRLASSVSAAAVTSGTDIAFARARLDTSSTRGRALLGHELAHVIQQRGGPALLQRAPDHAKDHRTVTMHFDGQELIVRADGAEVFRFSAQSGRPVPLRPEDAAKVSADPVTDSYMNDKRFTGVQDLGPIPEGTYQFSPGTLQRFSAGEQMSLMVTPHSSTAQTATGAVSGGDWGAGRVALTPVGKLREGPIPGANRRSGFFLHGGIMAGSSGCIDVGTSFSTLADWLEGYGRAVQLTVAYEHPAPTVGPATGLSGMLAYRQGAVGIQPRLGLGAESSARGIRPLISPQADLVLRWAGGSLSAGARFDVALTDRDQFVRLGLQSTLNLRLFQHLFAELTGGYSAGLSKPAGSGMLVGAGLQADFGRVQLGLLYDHLSTSAAADPQVHQVLFSAGLRFP